MDDKKKKKVRPRLKPISTTITDNSFGGNSDDGLGFGHILTPGEVTTNSKEEDENGETILVGPYKKNELGVIAGFCYAFSDRIIGNFRFGYSILPVANKVVILNGRTVGGSYNNSVQIRLLYLLNDAS